MKLGPIARMAVAFALALTVLTAVMSLRAAFEARALLAQAERSLASAALDRAIVELRLAARWNAPLNLYAARAFDSLERVAVSAEHKGELERALAAYRAIHASAMASRGFYVPEQNRLERADARIAALVGALASGDTGRRVAREAPSSLRAVPSSAFVLVAWLGLVSWVVGASVFMVRGVDHEGRVVRRVARSSALLTLAGWLAFALGLRAA